MARKNAKSDQETELLRLMLGAEQPRKRRVSKRTKERVLARDGHACFYCGGAEGLQIDHVVAVALGGMDDDSNLVTACGKCNRDKRASSVPAWKERLMRKITRGR